MPKDQVRFNQRNIERLRAPETGRRVVHDTEQQGLVLRVTPGGCKTFCVQRWMNGRTERVKLGRWPDLTVTAARRQARAMIGRIADGANPADDKRQARDEWTIGELWEHFHEHHLKSRCKAKTAHDYKLWYEKHLKRWASRSISSIRRADVQRLHGQIGKTAPTMANRVIAVISSMYSHARRFGYEGVNPARDIEAFRERSRDRYLTADEFPRFWKALEADPSDNFRDFIKMLLFTGARRGNVQAMRWDNLDIKAGVWRIPDTKAGEAQTIYLPDVARDILKRRKTNTQNEYVFPGRHRGHLKEPMNQWRELLKRAGITDLNMHDLRRSLGSWMAAGGSSLQIIGRQLGHKRQETTAIYSRLDLTPIQQSVDVAVNAMLSAAQSKEDAPDVVGRIG